MGANTVADRVRRRSPAVESALPVVATVALFVAFPFHWQLRWGPASINMSYGDGVVALVLALWLLGAFGARRLPKYAVPVAGFLGAAGASLGLAALLRPATLDLAAGVVESVKIAGAVAWALAAFVVARRDPRRLVPIGAAVSVALAVGFAASTLYSAVGYGVVRPEGPFNNPNIFGNYLVFNACLALLVARSWIGSRWPVARVLGVLAVPVLVTGVVATSSRGSTVAVCGATVGILVPYARRVEPRTLVASAATVGTGVVAAVVTLAVSDAAVLAHLRARLAKDLDNRFEMWGVAVDALLSSPVLGIGYGQLPGYMAAAIGREYAAHNVYLTVAAETGLLGLVAFLGLLWWVAADGWRLAPVEPAAIFLAAVVGATALQGVGTDVDNFRALWIAVGLAASYEAHRFDADRSPRALARAVSTTVRRRLPASVRRP